MGNSSDFDSDIPGSSPALPLTFPPQYNIKAPDVVEKVVWFITHLVFLCLLKSEELTPYEDESILS